MFYASAYRYVCVHQEEHFDEPPLDPGGAWPAALVPSHATVEAASMSQAQLRHEGLGTVLMSISWDFLACIMLGTISSYIQTAMLSI